VIGSIYGEGLYSADLYSWEVAWGYEVCDETEALVRRETYQLPPPTSGRASPAGRWWYGRLFSRHHR
jgi:hypothetical protein